MTAARLVAVTGATGFVGQALLDAAARAGLEVRALARRPRARRPGVEWITGDLADAAALARLCNGASAVIHVAGVVNAPDAAAFEAGNVTGTLSLIEAARAAAVPRLIQVSSLAAREPALSAYGASKARAERLVAASGLDWTMVRPPWIYGPRDGDTLDMFRAARWGVVPAPKASRVSLLHVDDLARLLVALVPLAEGTTRQTYEPDDARPGGWSTREVARGIGWAMGKRVWAPQLSGGTLMAFARLDRLFRRSKARLTPDRARYMAHPDWMVSPNAQPPATLWSPIVKTPAGLKATANWYRENGWI